MRDDARDVEAGRLPDVGWRELARLDGAAEVIAHELVGAVVAVPQAIQFLGDALLRLDGRGHDEAEALPDMIRFARGIGLPDWMVPETFLFLWEDDKIVGQFRIRHYLNDALREGGGHIGQFIKKEYRGKGYGTKGLALTLEVARTIVPEDEFYLRVNRDNPASLKVMQKNGGRIVK